jgi:cytochrome c553
LTIRACIPAVCFAALASAAGAAEVPAPPAEIAELVETCVTCHGEDGVPLVEDAPIIWGQEYYYSYTQMRDFQAGRRESEIMQPLMDGLEKDTLKALAQYFAALQWPALGYSAPAADAAVGAAAAVAGQCPQCHLGAWVGNSGVPRLAGQTVQYLEKTMLDFKYNRRRNAPDIAAIFREMSDEELRSLARYAAGK